ncbi:hypothetical protein [Lacticigenium naphthae]|uniref:DUF1659 domain-containing protein n=1 Tax=Lacticigenium naphthae TaxID=515351 RepID=UPI0004138F09|nr:hypothetical protein [Lacticigenium naphthae]
MIKQWNGGKVVVCFEDAENEKVVRRSYNDSMQDLGPEQVEQFSDAIASLSVLPTIETVVTEEFKYIR